MRRRTYAENVKGKGAQGMGKRAAEVSRIVDAATCGAVDRKDAHTRWATVKGMASAFVEAAALAGILFLVTGGIALLPIVGGDPDRLGNRVLIAALVALVLALAYLASTAQRQVMIWGTAVDRIRDVTREP